MTDRNARTSGPALSEFPHRSPAVRAVGQLAASYGLWATGRELKTAPAQIYRVSRNQVVSFRSCESFEAIQLS